MLLAPGSYWINIKHNRLYIVAGEVIDSNSSNPGIGDSEILYYNPEAPCKFFRRAYAEFMQKFRPRDIPRIESA